MSWPWSELGLDGPASLKEVRQAYAQRLKETHPEEDPEGFQRLHDAYQAARRTAKKAQSPGAPRPMEMTAEERETPKAEKRPSRGFGELLEQEEPQRETPEGGKSASWDFDELLEPEQEREPEETPRETQTWDYERIFREGQQEQTERRRRQYYPQRSTQHGADDWEQVDFALQVVCELLEQGRPLSEWMDFFNSGAFFRVKGHPDFLGGLEEVLQHVQILDETIKNAFIRVYGLDTGGMPKMYRPLREILCRRAPLTQGQRRKRRRRILVLLVVWLCIAGLLWIPRLADNRAAKRLCREMEEDLGRPIQVTDVKYDGERRRYLAAGDPELYFIAAPDGERDLENGRPGYQTNYGQAVMGQALKAFSEQWGYELEQYNGQNRVDLDQTRGAAAEAFYLELPIGEDGACITDLCRRFAAVQAEEWYSLIQPAFKLYLATDGVVYYTHEEPKDQLDEKKLREYYENRAGSNICRFMVEESGLAQKDFGGRAYEFTQMGTVTLHGDVYSAIEATDGESRRLYFYREKELYSVPLNRFDPNMDRMEYRRFQHNNYFPYQTDAFSSRVRIYRPLD